MPSNNIYPPISQLIPKVDLPFDLTAINDLLSGVFDNLYYKDAIIERSNLGDKGFYKFKLISFKEIGYEIPGTGGLALVLNPGFVDNGMNTSEFPISFSYQLEILKYINGFSSSEFQSDPLAFFNLLLEILGLSTSEILQETIETIIGGETAIQDFVDDFNLVRGALTNISANSGLDSNPFSDLILQIDSVGFDIITVLLEDYLDTGSADDFFDKIKRLFNKWFGDIDFAEIFKTLFIPEFRLALDALTLGLQFPETIFKPVVPVFLGQKTILTFDVGSFSYDSVSGFAFSNIGTFNFPESYILNTEFTLGIQGLKLDLSRDSNIPEAILDNRPPDFIGAYATEATIGFPAFWNHDDENSTGQIVARNLLVGTGGISGRLGLEAKTNGNPSPLICAKFGQGFEVCLTSFSIDFQQNAIIGSDIKGLMKIPKFEDASGNPAEIEIDIHIGQNGEFSVTAREPQGIPIVIPNMMQFNLVSAGVGREDDRFYLTISGTMEFINPTIASLFPAKIEFQEITIWDDGQFEIKGGGLELPQALSLKFPPVELSVTAIHLGSTERDYDNSGTNVPGRKYKYFGFDGSVKVDPGGVEAKGKGIQVYFSTDNDLLPLHVFVRIESLRIDIIIPGDADPKDAAVIIAGFLSVKDPPPGFPGTEYAGGISIDMPQAKIGGAAAMRFNPKVPYFIVDAELELSKAIPLGSTGLGLYGFRGLLGKYFVATKQAAGVADSEPWWKYYKAKMPNDYKEGVQISKFDPIGGFSVGLGVSLATSSDGGKIFSSKIFLLLSLRELLMLQGQAAILSDRIKLNDPNDPPFFALLVITRESIEAALGVNYLIPDDKDPGSIAAIQGVLELGFFFKDSSAWYLNIGRDLPESYRIQVRLFDLFDVYFYFMLNAMGIRAGAGASFEVDKKFGPLRAYLYAYLDITAKVAFKPKQLGGSIAMGGGVELSIFGLGFGFSVAASLAAEAPEPFVITGSLEVCIKVLKKERCAKFEFTWEFNNNVDTSEIGLINRAELGTAAQAVNIQTKESFAVNFVTDSSGLIYRGSSDPATWLPPAPTSSAWNGNFDNYIIPLDCFVDIDFKNGMNPNGNPSTDRIGKNGGANYTRYVAPQQGKTPRVKHDFKVEDIYIYAWNSTTNAWEEYDIYDAMTPMADLPFMDPAVISSLDLKQGYWQMEEANKYNKLRLLAQTPLSYMVQTSGEFIPENNGVTSESIFCVEEPRTKTCVNFATFVGVRQGAEGIVNKFNLSTPVVNDPAETTVYPNASILYPINEEQLYFFKEFSFRVIGGDAEVIQTGFTHLGNNRAIAINGQESLEIVFKEPVVCIDFKMFTYAQSVTVEYYHYQVDQSQPGITVIEQLITTDVFSAQDLLVAVNHLDAVNPVDKIVIRQGVCRPSQGNQITISQPAKRNGERIIVQTGTDSTAYGWGGANFYQPLKGRTLPLVEQGNNSFKDNGGNGSVVQVVQTIQGFWSNTSGSNGRLNEVGIQANVPLQEWVGFTHCMTVTDLNKTFNIGFAADDDVKIKINGADLVTMLQSTQWSHTHWHVFEVELNTGINVIEVMFRNTGNIGCFGMEIYQATQAQLMAMTTGSALQAVTIFSTITKVGSEFQLGTTLGYSCPEGYVLEYCSNGSPMCSRVELQGNETPELCGTFLYEVCVLSDEDYSYNQTIPDASEVAAQTQSMMDALEKTFQPIWRPNTTFAVAIKTNESVSGGGSNNHRNTFYYGFRTKGPIGHFHSYLDDSDDEVIRQDYQNLLDANQEDAYLLSKLQHYVDYRRSYPNADGDLLNAKPLFYGNPRLLLFFKKQYAYAMFGNWDALSGNDPVEGNMQIVIQDAIEPQVPPAPTLNWALDDFCIKGTDILAIDNMIQNSDPSGCPPESLNQNSVNAEVGITGLKPLKLYTAIFNNSYKRDTDTSTPTTVREVHRYPFRTSRYADFEEQVKSYKLAIDPLDDTIILKAAVFEVSKDMTAGLSLATNMLPPTNSDDLLTDYADLIERVLQGALKLGTLQPAVSTEFNIVRNTDDDGNILNTLGVWIRCPEPFNDPKLPTAEMQTTIRLSVNGDSEANYQAIFSKDSREVFITNADASLNMPAGSYAFTFDYREWNGQQYVTAETSEVTITIN